MFDTGLAQCHFAPVKFFICVRYYFSSYFIDLFAFLRATSTAYTGSQARGQIGATAAGSCHSHSNSESESHLQPTAHGNTGSLTHWARPEIKPTSSWILVRFISAEPQWKLLNWYFWVASHRGWWKCVKFCWITLWYSIKASLSLPLSFSMIRVICILQQASCLSLCHRPHLSSELWELIQGIRDTILEAGSPTSGLS